MNDADRKELERAKRLLTTPGLAMKLTSYVGKPVELALRALPAKATDLVTGATRRALDKALDVALYTLDHGRPGTPRNWSHRAAVWASGGLGGALGLAGLPFELPISTTLMLRSIADQARAQGEDLATPEARLNCMLVLALGGPGPQDDAANSGYFAVRVALARAVTEAAEYLASRAAAGEVAERTVPALVRFITSIAARFGIAVEEKLAAQAVPLVGALGGAVLNDLFMTHFQDTGLGHFTVRRLEREHGPEAVRLLYDQL